MNINTDQLLIDFHHLCRSGNLNEIKAKIKEAEIHGVKAKDFISSDDELALRIACQNGYLDVVKYLTGDDELKEKGALANPCILGGDVLNLAVESNHLNVVQYLMEDQDLALNFKNLHEQWDMPIVLMRCFQYDCFEIIKYLIKADHWTKSQYVQQWIEDKNLIEVFHLNAFYFAVENHNEKMMELLMTSDFLNILQWSPGPSNANEYRKWLGNFFIQCESFEKIEDVFSSDWIHLLGGVGVKNFDVFFKVMIENIEDQENNKTQMKKLKKTLTSKKIKNANGLDWKLPSHSDNKQRKDLKYYEMFFGISLKKARTVKDASMMHFEADPQGEVKYNPKEKVNWMLLQEKIKVFMDKNQEWNHEFMDLKVGKELIKEALVEGNVEFLKFFVSFKKEGSLSWNNVIQDGWVQGIRECLRFGRLDQLLYAIEGPEALELGFKIKDAVSIDQMFQWACEGGSLKAVQWVLDQESRWGRPNIHAGHDQALKSAAMDGHVQVVDFLLGFKNKDLLKWNYDFAKAEVLQVPQNFNNVCKYCSTKMFEWLMFNYELKETQEMKKVLKKHPIFDEAMQAKRDYETLSKSIATLNGNEKAIKKMKFKL